MSKKFFTAIFLFASLIVIVISGCQDYTGSEVVLYYPDSIPQIKVYYKKVNDHEYVAKQDVFYKNGQLSVSGYFNPAHKKTGKWISYFEDGTIQRIEHYEEDMKDGKYYEYYPSGKKMYTAIYKNGLPDGKWVIYDGDGKVMSKITYKDGKPINQK